ncbi:hypothetical protein ACQ5SO_05065 [Rhodovulum sp. DZ06]|uniref:hypothetical protein n=1 Tax=Rhodovulum sp. DZ06 TaxID=3425126 RepID=UPI003D344250
MGASVMFFGALNAMKVPSFAALGLFSAESLAASALFIPLALASSWAGARLVRRIDARSFNAAINVILLGVAVVLLAQAWAGARAAGAV